MCVSEFGPLPCSIITTTRKFFTVLGSVLMFGNTLLTHQWIGAALVFAGIFLDGVYGKQKASVAKQTLGIIIAILSSSGPIDKRQKTN